MTALLLHRIHFAFTITYHYLFPQLTMGLALLIVVLKTIALTRRDDRYNQAARFWAKIFAINFLLGVVTRIPMEFQFGTDWSEFSRRAGGIIGQPLAMEGVFSFFLKSTSLKRCPAFMRCMSASSGDHSASSSRRATLGASYGMFRSKVSAEGEGYGH